MIPKDLDPSFKLHIIWSIGWLIGGIFLLNFIIGGSTTYCDLEKNPLCPEQVEEVRIGGFFGWCITVCILVVIRTAVHKIMTSRNNEVNQL